MDSNKGENNVEIKNMDNHKNTRSTPKFKILESSENLVTAVLGITTDNRYFSKEKSYLKARIREKALDYDGYIRCANDYYITDYSNAHDVNRRLDSLNKAANSLAFLSSAVRYTPSLISKLDPNHKEMKAIAKLISENRKLLNGWNSTICRKYEESSQRKNYVDNILASNNCPIYFIIPDNWTAKRRNEIIYSMDFGFSKY